MAIYIISSRGGNCSPFEDGTRGMFFKLVLTLTSICWLSGCSPDDPLQRRQEEFRYTSASLAEELIPRLKRASESVTRRASGGPSDLARQVAEREADRGGDGNRADPNTVDAIVADVVGKLPGLAVADADPPAVDQLLEQLSQTAEVPQDILQEFADKLRAAQVPATR